MDSDDESIKNTKRKRKKVNFIQRYITCSMSIFQPIWVRCCPILSNKHDGRYLESQFNFVLYCGTIFWVIYLLF